ncbi:tetratricopeptide repeat protein 37 isoform X1 [Cataglyphis hispanica]|uniref:tetratricopeptide repeat protein 37 isoform X1 n=1 Tax=Cataglyphis hispanica TaxID=1086592 RepID=UPI0021808529|nr:tetratricopeptide repeat protein 37 isoform X1 [Cataglyphis hispanica]XP_050460411.1 tetratricopeptide repeat protein 37 isoform X1 [Cataglyphis hispanica]XP_050460412.1 tetratricopeptide repeat protein 37 isoform X1 [Cataglyphis hispanica]XP_050460413.1 tetratricopeptide repeat protein 37 isoform X1 [Cataglyphis hispanica]XP_050460414.1 tetratricopeptide repeat protein 37 isoform X1 [Cataglyphis hispanica]
MSDDIKILLKEARESFKQNEYLETMKKCKKVLKKDKNNYTALILLARAMQEIEEFKTQVVLVLQKAVEIQPNNPLAWQGLVAYYEKMPQDNDNWEKLVLAYCKLLQLDSDSPKFTYFINKVSEIVLRIKNDDILSQVLDTLSVLREISTKEKTSLIDKTLAWVLTEYSDNTMTKYQEFYEDILASVINDTDLVNRQEYYRKYLKMLYDSNKFTILLTAAQDMHSQFPQDVCPLEWICRVYYEEAILNEKDLDINITQIYESLLKLNANSEAALIAKAAYLNSSEKLINSRECLNQIILLNAQLFYAWLLLSKIYYKLYCWEQTENASKQVLQLMKPNLKDKLYCKVKLRLLEAMSRSNNKQKLTQTQQTCEELLKTEPSVHLQLIYARISVLLDKPDAIVVLNSLESQDEVKVQAQAFILKALYLKKHKQYEEAINTLELALNNSEAWLMFGKIYWDMGDYNHSLMAFLNGVQADRNNWECMIYLGHYYREHGNDIERSRRCYHTALQINPNSEEAGIGLSTAYRLLKNTDANIQLLQRVTMQQTAGAKWAWLQLGLQYLDQGDAGQAIKALQHVIRADPNDNHSWESLADAYLVRGAHTSALKSYQRALQLNPEALYPKIQLANIKLLIGQHKEAKEDFENILENDKQYILALKGLAQACLGLARENITKQFLCRARENLQQAADNLTDAIMIRSDLSCNWKLLGDVCFRTAGMPEKYCFLRVKPILMKSDSIEEHMSIRGNEILRLSIRCFCRALSTAQNSALLWHDLACCYSMQLDRNSTLNKDDTAAKCLAAAKHAVKLCPQSWLHWNILGVICISPYIKNYALAQHCFIMAIDRESNNATAWSNLGTLYLHLGDIYRANEAFSRAQRADPSYINSWIGQGIIAENLLRKEAMDLFRHSMQLGYHNEAASGYAHWVLTTLLNSAMKRDPLFVYVIEKMHAIPAAADALTWYTEHVPNDVYALNTHGLLLERLKLYNTAVKQFIKALKLSQVEEKDMISINLARVLIQIGKHEQAIELCRQVKHGSFNSQCHLALSLFKAKQYEESYNMYEAALHWMADTETHKANVLCAMAAIAYIFQGADAVKTLLFQCIQIKPPTIAGFLATAALGILHDDFNLTSLVLKELKPYTDHHEYGHHVITLSAYYHVIQGNLTEAIRIFSKAIFRHPNDIKYWVRLVRVSLLNKNLDIFRKCAQTALILSRNTSMTDIVYVACASAYSDFGTTEGLRQAQKNIFTYPTNVESWANFIAALLPRCANKDFKINNQWISSLISIIRSQFQTSEYMSQWLLHNIQELNNS